MIKSIQVTVSNITRLPLQQEQACEWGRAGAEASEKKKRGVVKRVRGSGDSDCGAEKGETVQRARPRGRAREHQREEQSKIAR